MRFRSCNVLHSDMKSVSTVAKCALLGGDALQQLLTEQPDGGRETSSNVTRWSTAHEPPRSATNLLHPTLLSTIA